jgi:hypothetical protein
MAIWSFRCSTVATVFPSLQWLWPSRVCSGYGLPVSAVAMVFQCLQWLWPSRVWWAMFYRGYCLPESAVAMVFHSLQWLGLPESAGPRVIQSLQWLWSSRVCSGIGLPGPVAAMVYETRHTSRTNNSPKALQMLLRDYSIEAEVTKLSY